MKSKKLEVLTELYKELSTELGKLDNAQLQTLLESWSQYFSQISELLNAPNNKIKPSQIASGLEQGLRETHLILSELDSENRDSAIKTFYAVVGKHLPSFFQKSKIHLQRILDTGRIKNENEWHLVRYRIDEIEGNPNSATELSALYELLDRFEASA